MDVTADVVLTLLKVLGEKGAVPVLMFALYVWGLQGGVSKGDMLPVGVPIYLTWLIAEICFVFFHYRAIKGKQQSVKMGLARRFFLSIGIGKTKKK